MNDFLTKLFGIDIELENGSVTIPNAGYNDLFNKLMAKPYIRKNVSAVKDGYCLFTAKIYNDGWFIYTVSIERVKDGVVIKANLAFQELASDKGYVINM